jgi:predicted ArsR family transcriptional regulator
MAGYNQTKVVVLELLGEGGLLASEVAALLGLSVGNASQRLGRYFRDGDCRRFRRKGFGGRPSYVYELSAKGLDKLRKLV